METILLTGASGYLGGCVAEKAAEYGMELRPLGGRLEHLEPSSLDPAIVIHCAGALRHRRAEVETANHLGTRRLLTALRQPSRVIYISSRSVYALTGAESVDETAAVVPWDDYGWSKLRGEEAVKQSGHEFVILRVPGLFGHGLRRLGMTFPCVAMDRFLRGESVTLYLPDRPHDYLWVQALADLLLLKVLAPGAHWGGVFNVAGPPRSLGATIETIADVVRDRTGLQTEIERKPGPPPAGPLLSAKQFEETVSPVNQPSDRAIAADMLDRVLGATAN